MPRPRKVSNKKKSSSMVAKKAVDHFLAEVKKETDKLRAMCEHWRGVLNATQHISEDSVGDINVAIGQGELLMKERFVQFCGLIEDCRLGRGEKEVTPQDLQGFWDIIYVQVEDVLRKFHRLDCLEKEDVAAERKSVPVQAKVAKKIIPKQPCPKKLKASSGLHAHIQAARQKLKQEKEAKLKEKSKFSESKLCNEVENTNIKETNANGVEKENSPPSNTEKVVFDAGFFKVETPAKKRGIEKKKINTPGKARVHLLASRVLKEQMKNSPVAHKNYSPCMRVTRSMKKKMNDGR
ncbi:hypothetical protein Pcinc_021254 [Petrolisthes cinctipes]|uniref:Uncharacterized protein n=1 Tax=Petrolisthes cinctipes TaxID=88211 RepID=A0AAE1FGA8_PETCI|nr:hypothetical protein Pcinc_021254 [Petrolisthes cinctipes]